MNRGRIKWENISNVITPKYVQGYKEIEQLAIDLERLWSAYEKLQSGKNTHMKKIVENLEVEGDDAQRRWLAFKPPE